ncbi:hypothetical protein KAS08_03505 [Candidatus Pacearchaeota archaeon]|nr:hypothetical protein [Candidatus Pacearchaeota archaeon]
MTTLDKIIQMQQQGMPDATIISQLQNEGISPAEINDSINQAKIKNAVSPPDISAAPATPQGMAPSMTQDPNAIPIPNAPATPSPEVYPPQAPIQSAMPAPGIPAGDPYAAQAPQAPVADPYAGQAYPPQDQYAPQDPYAAQAPQDNYYQQTPQGYSDQEYYGGGGAASTETISEIAEQVTTEKLNAYKKKVGDIASFKNTIQDKVADIDDRLKRIESTIDKLQQAIIGKIGEFGESNAMIHKDLENLHGTVGKLMNPLVDTYNELKKK